MRSCASSDATEMPCTRSRFRITSVSARLAWLPPRKPITPTNPCMRVAWIDCASVLAPTVSTTASTPCPPVSSRTRAAHCGSAV